MSKKLQSDFSKRASKINFSSVDTESISGSIVQIVSNKELTVDGCKRIIDYYENLIKLRLIKGNITVVGRNLIIETLTDDSAVIKGIIDSVEFEGV